MRESRGADSRAPNREIRGFGLRSANIPKSRDFCAFDPETPQKPLKSRTFVRWPAFFTLHVSKKDLPLNQFS
jgi:hypothetical protein